jgi:hypothetical protein
MRKTKLPSLISILIMTLITAVIWVTFDVYRLFKKAEVPVVPETVSAPLNPSFDDGTINEIKSRIYLDDAQIPDTVVTGSKVSESSVEEQVTTSPEPTPEATQQPENQP